MSEWISVKDRLPDNSDDVLICCTGWDGMRSVEWGWYRTDMKEWVANNPEESKENQVTRGKRATCIGLIFAEEK